MKLQGRNLVFGMQGSAAHELLRELTVQIYGKITSKLAVIFQHRQRQASNKETTK
jgi:hypothetical protein